jgi:hypothetical protein
MKIYKYSLELALSPIVTMPKGAEVLSVGVQHDIIVLWAKVDPMAANRWYQFYVVGTGYDAPDNAKYIGTVQQGPFVWHIFMELT